MSNEPAEFARHLPVATFLPACRTHARNCKGLVLFPGCFLMGIGIEHLTIANNLSLLVISFP